MVVCHRQRNTTAFSMLSSTSCSPNRTQIFVSPVRVTFFNTAILYLPTWRFDGRRPIAPPISSEGSDPQSFTYALIAVIYVKNRVNRAWAGTDHFPNEHPIPEDEKARVRDRLLPILASSQGLIRQQLIPILQRILHWDFPEKWPTFMDFTIQLLNTNDPSSVLAGLQCLLAICRAYRFKAGDGENRTHFDKIIEASFPRLLAISSELVAQESEEAGEMLHIALKAYKHATWVSQYFSGPTLLGIQARS